jgi:signal transduction histidine kinase
METKQLVDQISQFEQLSDIPRSQIEWVVERGELRSLKRGDVFFHKGDPIDKLFMIVDGLLAFRIEQNGNYKEIGRFERGAISGALPYSRAETALAIGETLADSQVFTLDKIHFKDLICECHDFTTFLVHQMTDRVRTFTRQQQQNEKLMALGKLSAGLAHEMNNPAAAIVRSAESLQEHLGTVPDKFKKMMTAKVDLHAVDFVNDMLYAKVQQGVDTSASLMERTEKEDDLTDWLEDNGYGDCYALSETLADFSFDPGEMQELLDKAGPETFPKVIEWIDNVLTTEKMVAEIKEASDRISSLVNSVKSYSHMDRADDMEPTDVHLGLRNTVTMLNHKIKKGGIALKEEFEKELPMISGLAGELNQVWTNVIDNALDALEQTESPALTISTLQKGDSVHVHIKDNGPGIPEENKDRIFEPFFTTKDIGKGTGLGLETAKQIVLKHKGSIDLSSKPGETIFKFCFPINQ